MVGRKGHQRYRSLAKGGLRQEDDLGTVYWSLWPSTRWLMPTKERYWGQFQATTKTPTLYVNAQHDPAAPLIVACNASQSFEGSSVLQTDGYGHGLFYAPSECIARHVRAYFLNATLPTNGTYCEPDGVLLKTWLATANASATSSNSTGNKTGSATDPTSSPVQSQVTKPRCRVHVIVVMVSCRGLPLKCAG